MAWTLAREYTDESVCSAGAVSPLAVTSYLLAKRTHAPGLTLITTGGGYVDVAWRPMLLGAGEALDFGSALYHTSGDGTYHVFYQPGPDHARDHRGRADRPQWTRRTTSR